MDIQLKAQGQKRWILVQLVVGMWRSYRFARFFICIVEMVTLIQLPRFNFQSGRFHSGHSLWMVLGTLQVHGDWPSDTARSATEWQPWGLGAIVAASSWIFIQWELWD